MELLIRDGTYLNSKQEESFVCKLIDDLEKFSDREAESLDSKRVYFLPPLPPRLRFLTHQTVESVFYGRLSTKSVGEGEERRTAIFALEKSPQKKESLDKFDSKRGQTRLSSAAGMKEETKESKKARKAEVAVYRPPHRRDAPPSPSSVSPKNHEPKDEIKEDDKKEDMIKEPLSVTPKARAKRPDLQVYVPRARRSTDAAPTDEKEIVIEPKSVETTPVKPQRRVGVCSVNLKVLSLNATPEKSVQRESSGIAEASSAFSSKLIRVQSEPIVKVSESKCKIERVHSLNSGDSRGETMARIEPKREDFIVTDGSSVIAECVMTREDEDSGIILPKSPRKYFDKPRLSRPRKTSFVPVEEQTSEPIFETPKLLRKPSMHYHGKELDQPSDEWRVEVSELYNGCADLTERHESSGYNSADSDKKEEGKLLSVITNVEEVDEENLKFANQMFDLESRDFDSASSKGDDDSWDCIFNDDGEPVKPEVLEELTLAVGKSVRVSKPKIDYLSFVPSSVDESQFDEELSHVVEFYDFSPSLKTEDLLIIFGGIRQSGGKTSFDIKWVDDTHALGVYSNPSAAVEALKLIHPLAKARSLAQASRDSKLKARKTSEFLQPFKPRPATTASLARRLVTGALGLKSTVSPEQRKAEAQKLRDAKANKKMAAKQREDAWEGNFDSS